MLLSCLSRSTNLPSAIIARCGYVWLPIGRPSGFADAVPALARTNPAAAAPAAVFPKNSRLVIGSIVIAPDRRFLSLNSGRRLFLGRGGRCRRLARERER